MQTTAQLKPATSNHHSTQAKAQAPARATPNMNETPLFDPQPKNATRLGHSFGGINVLPPDLPVQTKRAQGMVSRLTAFNSANQGNATVIPRLPASWTVRPSIQAKLTVGQPNEQYEQEADRVADQVMRMTEPRVQAKCACGGDAGVDGECAACKAKRLADQSPVQTKPEDAKGVVQTKSASDGMSPQIQTSSENRTGMPDHLKAGVEQLSGLDMSDVRVYTNSPKPAQLNALAYAQGKEIHVGPGQEKHLPHEAWHVVQQKQGRVQPTMQMKDGVPVNHDKGLEHEADVMGARAASGAVVQGESIGFDPIDSARGERVLVPGGTPSIEVVQPRLGFEIEMLLLIDSNGRPLPEKTHIGAVGAHLNIDVDHGPAVDAPTPTAAADARYDVDTIAAGADIEMRHTGVGGPDPRPPMQELNLATWNATTNSGTHAEFTRPASPIPPIVNNAPLTSIDQALQAYNFNYKNWEPVRASANLNAIMINVHFWTITNNNKPNKVLHPTQRARWRRVRNALRELRQRARVHSLFWANPAHANPPANIRREFRPTVPAPGAWGPYQPHAGMGANHYASIVELVTNAYPPETPAGRANILAAMTDAVNFANALHAATAPNGTNRVALNTVAGAGGVAGNIFVGNPAQPAQTTDGSIQATGAIDLAQFPSYVLSMTARNPQDANVLSNQEFNLKHHSDTDDTEGDRVRAELPQAVANATAAVNGIKVGLGAPNMENLRGLVVLICQYLRMGRHFFGHGVALDKNIVPFLSRTNLSQIYERLVPTAEKNWLVAGGRLATLKMQILLQTNRTGVSNLFNDAGENNPGGAGISCQTFIDNVFNGVLDDVTNNLGGFHKMATEDVDPTGARGGDWISPMNHPKTGALALHREGFVFEMRNMARRLTYSGGRFPRTQWLKLAEQQVAVFETLNARTEASAIQDHRVRHAGYGNSGGPNRLNRVGHTDAAW